MLNYTYIYCYAGSLMFGADQGERRAGGSMQSGPRRGEAGGGAGRGERRQGAGRAEAS